MSSTSHFCFSYLPRFHYWCFIFFLSNCFPSIGFLVLMWLQHLFPLLEVTELIFVLLLSSIHVPCLGIFICSPITEYHLSKGGCEYLSPMCVLAVFGNYPGCLRSSSYVSWPHRTLFPYPPLFHPQTKVCHLIFIIFFYVFTIP